MNPIDSFLNKLTMYRVVLYGLLLMVLFSLIASVSGHIPFKILELVTLLATLTFVCFFGNIFLSKIYKVAPNSESSVITALILYFLLWPSVELENVALFLIAGIGSIMSKYILAYRRKHIFNPAAFGALLLALFGSGGLWWAGTPVMIPITLVVGLLIVRKIRRFTMFLTFLAITYCSFALQAGIRGLPLIDESYQFFTSFPVIFFGTIMLTEPLTMPPTRRLQIIYASLVSVLFSWQGGFGPIILTTELVLIIGNVFSFVVSPKYRFALKLIQSNNIAKDTHEFVFEKPRGFSYRPGQYMEWTVPQFKSDGRGNRRYFTLASSPTEETVRLGVRFNAPSSSFKTFLKGLKPGDKVFAGQLTGDFTLPQKVSEKMVLIAGGIGVTPFRSFLQYLLDKKEKRDIVLFYANKTHSEIAYKDLFDKAAKELGIKIVYIISDPSGVPKGWTGETGRIDKEKLNKYIPDLKDRTYFISGPNAMVEGYKKLLSEEGISSTAIVTDYFPGF